MNPLPLEITLGEKYGPAMVIKTQEEADAYFKLLVDHNESWRERDGRPESRAEAEKTEKANLGYWAGYYDNETRDRVERLFRCSHPIFGSIAQKGPPTPEEAFEMGKKMGEKLK